MSRRKCCCGCRPACLLVQFGGFPSDKYYDGNLPWSCCDTDFYVPCTVNSYDMTWYADYINYSLKCLQRGADINGRAHVSVEMKRRAAPTGTDTDQHWCLEVEYDSVYAHFVLVHDFGLLRPDPELLDVSDFYLETAENMDLEDPWDGSGITLHVTALPATGTSTADCDLIPYTECYPCASSNGTGTGTGIANSDMDECNTVYPPQLEIIHEDLYEDVILSDSFIYNTDPLTPASLPQQNFNVDTLDYCQMYQHTLGTFVLDWKHRSFVLGPGYRHDNVVYEENPDLLPPQEPCQYRYKDLWLLEVGYTDPNCDGGYLGAYANVWAYNDFCDEVNVYQEVETGTSTLALDNICQPTCGVILDYIDATDPPMYQGYDSTIIRDVWIKGIHLAPNQRAMTAPDYAFAELVRYLPPINCNAIYYEWTIYWWGDYVDPLVNDDRTWHKTRLIVKTVGT